MALILDCATIEVVAEKIAVVNRYQEKPIAVAFIKNFGLKRGALASSVAHDSHNIIVVGVDDESICKAVNAIVQEKGGLAVTDAVNTEVLGLPVAGLVVIHQLHYNPNLRKPSLPMFVELELLS